MDGQESLVKYEPSKAGVSLPIEPAPVIRERTAMTVALDNLIRRKLRISDPTNADQIANALLSRYPRDKEALEREAAGAPFITFPTPARPVMPTNGRAEVNQATDDVERDLMSLSTNALVKDIFPELKGWATAIRSTVADGLDAARFGMDARQRDKAFAFRRRLGDYARIARFIGVLTPNLNADYRRLAQSLDEVSALLLVLMGDAIANVGFGGGRFLLQAPLSELQERRDAIIYALRNLMGSTQYAYGPSEWPRGLVAYEQLLRYLEQNGQSDLRAFLQEHAIARVMDELIEMAASDNSDGLRALSSTALIALEAFDRLIIIGRQAIEPESPPLSAFLTALQLFVDAFENARSGHRLLHIARPPILFYGLYGIGGIDNAGSRLRDLVIKRGDLAERLDCFLGCACGPQIVRCQIVLDSLLYDIDRAIDLYALGTEDFGEPEQRAGAYGYVIQAVQTSTLSPCLSPNQIPAGSAIGDILETVKATLWQHAFAKTEFADVPPGVIDGTVTNGPNWFPSSAFLLPFYVPGSTSGLNRPFISRGTLQLDDKPLGVFDSLRTFHGIPTNQPIPERLRPLSLRRMDNMFTIMTQELLIQRAAEPAWIDMVKAMSPACIAIDDPVGTMLDEAVNFIDVAAEMPSLEPSIPPDLETSVAGISYLRHSHGGF
jgi:hypothetical protein